MQAWLSRTESCWYRVEPRPRSTTHQNRRRTRQMTADRPNLATGARRLLATLAAVAIPAVIAAAPAVAAAAPADCTPDDSTACVVAIVLDEDSNPVPDVGVTISGAGFEQDVTTTQ